MRPKIVSQQYFNRFVSTTMSFIVNLRDNQFPNRTIRNIELRPAKEKPIMDSILSRPLGLCRPVNGAEVRIRGIELRKHIQPNEFNPCHA
jgi:hypothetical protein